MKKRQKHTSPVLQLCLFTASEMASMVEYAKPLKEIELPADPARLVWEIEIGQLLTGRKGREHRRMFTRRRRRAVVVGKALVLPAALLLTG